MNGSLTHSLENPGPAYTTSAAGWALGSQQKLCGSDESVKVKAHFCSAAFHPASYSSNQTLALFLVLNPILTTVWGPLQTLFCVLSSYNEGLLVWSCVSTACSQISNSDFQLSGSYRSTLWSVTFIGHWMNMVWPVVCCAYYWISGLLTFCPFELPAKPMGDLSGVSLCPLQPSLS